MAVAALVSKITGFLRTVVIVWVLGFSVAADAYNAAGSMPNQVYELLVGGVLTSVLVPLLVRARADDPDGGELYAQRLFTMTTCALLLVTVLAVLGAPVLTSVLVDESTGRADPGLTTAFAYLLLPQILFYGWSALFGATLNAREVFGPPAWAPVLNNVILIAAFGLYLAPGLLSLDPLQLSATDVLVLGAGSTLGVAVQAVALVPALLRSGFRFRWRWGWDPRFREFSGLAAWTVAYALLAQLGVLAVINVTTAHGGLTTYNTVWLLVQLPYGVLGYALVTAILPRMSRAAADGDLPRLGRDLSLATRLSAVVMLPVTALLVVLGATLATALFSVGHGASDAGTVGTALVAGAFGVLPYAVTLLQLRVFYALKDARTPALIMLLIVAVKVALTMLSPVLLPAHQVVHGVVFANSCSFVVGWVAGELCLRARLGGARRDVAPALARSAAAAAAAGACALAVRWALPDSPAWAWPCLAAASVCGLAAAWLVLLLTRSPELRQLPVPLLRGSQRR
nr:murein biosynthesis integral membrane protein MurJ [Saccharopolyspora sp. HNM0983]